MLRLALLMILISFPAQAGGAKWWDMDCGEMPFAVPEDFTCRGGENVPADTIKLTYGKRDTPKEFSMVYVATATGLDWLTPITHEQRIEDFKAIHPWIRKHGRDWQPTEHGASALGPGWRCLYQRLLRKRKGQGHRYAIYLVHCKPGWEHLDPSAIRALRPR